jgi:hypothetical protein
MALLSPNNPEQKKNVEMNPEGLNPERDHKTPEVTASEPSYNTEAARETLERIDALKKLKVEGNAYHEPQRRTIEAVQPLPALEARQYLTELLSGNNDIKTADDAHDVTEFIENNQSSEDNQALR